jgi:4-amino-4-deoxy-L-arabinose transferase-like glycosyltransferase
MKFRSLFRNRGLGMNLLASFCFLLLAVFGWGLEWSELGQYLLILLILLGGIIGSAALMGWLLRQFIKWRNRNDDQF